MSAAPEDKYRCEPQQRILRLLTTLAGHEVDGLAPSEIARSLSTQASITTRDLANLKQAGMAEQIPATGRWRLSPQIVQIALRHQVAMERARSRLDETAQRYSRN
jgi:DNA-binding IclR family transcriptional regulator